MSNLSDAKKMALCNAVDNYPVLNGAGIILLDRSGREIKIRTTISQYIVFIQEHNVVQEMAFESSPQKKQETFWNRWGDIVLNCGSAGATGIVIGLSGGSVGIVAGAFALNSAALCGISIGKKIASDSWVEFEKVGGFEYKAWLTVETLMSLADLFNGAKGAATFLKEWKQAGKLANLRRIIGNRKLTRKQLLRAIQLVEPGYRPSLNGFNYVRKVEIVGKGQEIIEAARFRDLTNQRWRVFWQGIGDGLTIGGAPQTVDSAKNFYSKVAFDVWIVMYKESSLGQ